MMRFILARSPRLTAFDFADVRDMVTDTNRNDASDPAGMLAGMPERQAPASYGFRTIG
jgi:hypothetical protein